MSIETRLWDDAVFSGFGETDYSPCFVGALLMYLGVFASDPKTEREALKKWLESNEPNAPLVNDLRRQGFEDLLDSNSNSQEAAVTI